MLDTRVACLVDWVAERGTGCGAERAIAVADSAPVARPHSPGWSLLPDWPEDWNSPSEGLDLGLAIIVTIVSSEWFAVAVDMRTKQRLGQLLLTRRANLLSQSDSRSSVRGLLQG